MSVSVSSTAVLSPRPEVQLGLAGQSCGIAKPDPWLDSMTSSPPSSRILEPMKSSRSPNRVPLSIVRIGHAHPVVDDVHSDRPVVAHQADHHTCGLGVLADVCERRLRGPQQRHFHLGRQSRQGLVDIEAARNRAVFLEAGEQTADRSGQRPVLEFGRGEGSDDATHVPGTLRGEVLDLGEHLPGMVIGGALRLGVGDEPDRRDRLSDRVMDIAGDAGAFLDLAGMPLGQSELVLQVEQVLCASSGSACSSSRRRPSRGSSM